MQTQCVRVQWPWLHFNKQRDTLSPHLKACFRAAFCYMRYKFNFFWKHCIVYAKNCISEVVPDEIKLKMTSCHMRLMSLKIACVRSKPTENVGFRVFDWLTQKLHRHLDFMTWTVDRRTRNTGLYLCKWCPVSIIASCRSEHPSQIMPS